MAAGSSRRIGTFFEGQFGSPQQVAAATNGTTVLVTSASAAVAFFALGRLPVSYALVLGAACFVGALAGKFGLDGISKRFGLTNILIMVLAFILTISIFMVLGQSISSIVDGELDFGGFGDVCATAIPCSVGDCPLSPTLLPTMSSL